MVEELVVRNLRYVYCLWIAKKKFTTFYSNIGCTVYR